MDKYKTPIQLYKCNSKDIGNPGFTQFWKLTWHRKLRLWFKDECLQQNIVVDFCRHGNNREYQEWKYDIETKQMISMWRHKWCLTASVASDKSLFLSKCNSSDVNQKWTWGNVNEAALKRFDHIYWENDQVIGLNQH
jgi:Ricin-type beta-trefoil lectin domain